jgi:hypothetical protein
MRFLSNCNLLRCTGYADVFQQNVLSSGVVPQVTNATCLLHIFMLDIPGLRFHLSLFPLLLLLFTTPFDLSTLSCTRSHALLSVYRYPSSWALARAAQCTPQQ